jgi:hypothetical protein
MESGTFNFWIYPQRHPDAFAEGVRIRWAEFSLAGENCVICSDGPTLAAGFRMGGDNPQRIFRIQFRPDCKRRRHMVTVGWSKGKMKVYLDGKLLASVPLVMGRG